MSADEGPPWEELIVAERMAADREFQERVHASSLSNQAWSLVMMAVEFRVSYPDDPAQAHLTVDSENLDSVLPAMDEIEAATGHESAGSGNDGLFDEIRSWLGGGRGDADRRAQAEQLADQYATVLERQLRENGKWNAVCEIAADHA